MTGQPRNAVCIQCTDRIRSLDFYRDVLGATLLPGDSTITCPWLQLGDLTLTLFAIADCESDEEDSATAKATLLLQVDDVSNVFRRAKDYSARIVVPPNDDFMTFTLADPDGILIEIMRFDPDV